MEQAKINLAGTLMPLEIAWIAEETGISKASMILGKTILLSILAGIFIAIGAVFSTLVTSGSAMSYGVTKLLGGITFSLGLILVVIGGAELFTGNNLMVIAWASKRISIWQIMHNWFVVYLGNMIGALLVAVMILWSGHYLAGDGIVGAHILNIAAKKCELAFGQAVILGILCNMLVCLAIWLSYSTPSFPGKVLAIVFPITAFVAAGFEHSVANMYFISMGILVKSMINSTAVQFESISWGNFLYANLLPVTIGNIIGGSIFVGLAYWFAYVYKNKRSSLKTSIP
ncbi:MAG: formate/nitrite family transporter [Bacteroidales bacterium]|nr:formate/nitrite family transporter [Bacteroidales bacterium]